MDFKYTITKEIYIPSEHEVEYLKVHFLNSKWAVIGDLLTYYGKTPPFFNNFLKDILTLRSKDFDPDFINEKFWVFNDNGLEGDTGFNLGNIAVVCNPEYYPHVYYSTDAKEIIIIDPLNQETKPLRIDFRKFTDLLNWWKGYIDCYSNFNSKRS